MTRLVLKDELCSGCRLCMPTCIAEHFKTNNPRKASIKIDPELPRPHFNIITTTRTVYAWRSVLCARSRKTDLKDSCESHKA